MSEATKGIVLRSISMRDDFLLQFFFAGKEREKDGVDGKARHTHIRTLIEIDKGSRYS